MIPKFTCLTAECMRDRGFSAYMQRCVPISCTTLFASSTTIVCTADISWSRHVCSSVGSRARRSSGFAWLYGTAAHLAAESSLCCVKVAAWCRDGAASACVGLEEGIAQPRARRKKQNPRRSLRREGRPRESGLSHHSIQRGSVSHPLPCVPCPRPPPLMAPHSHPLQTIVAAASPVAAAAVPEAAPPSMVAGSAPPSESQNAKSTEPPAAAAAAAAAVPAVSAGLDNGGSAGKAPEAKVILRPTSRSLVDSGPFRSTTINEQRKHFFCPSHS